MEEYERDISVKASGIHIRSLMRILHIFIGGKKRVMDSWIRVFETDQWDPFRIQANIWEIRPEMIKDILKRYNHGYSAIVSGVFSDNTLRLFHNLVISDFSQQPSASKLTSILLYTGISFACSCLINSEGLRVSICLLRLVSGKFHQLSCNLRLYSVV